MGLRNCTADGPPFGRGQSAGHFISKFSDCIVCVALNHFICVHVETATEEVVYEVIAAPQEQPDHAQEERRENPAQGPSDPSSEQQPEGKPRCMPYYFKFMTPIYIFITCALGLGIFWNPSCMIPRFPGVILVCIG